MVRPLPDSLHQLIGLGGVVRVRCLRCGREARFSPGTLSRWFRLRGGRDDWAGIRRRFVCSGLSGEGCGSRRVDVTYELAAPELRPPPPPPRPVGECPPGIDPTEWAAADQRERRRLLRQLRG